MSRLAALKAKIKADTADADGIDAHVDDDIDIRPPKRPSSTSMSDFGQDAIPDLPTRDITLDLAAMTGLPTASSNQVDIFQHIYDQVQARKRGAVNLISMAVQAVAGSGKTTTVVAAAKLLPREWSSIFLAFNRSIAKELAERLPGHVKSRTLNGLGMMLTTRYLKSIGIENVDVRANRTFTILRACTTPKEMEIVKKDVVFLVSMCKALGVVPLGCQDGEGIGGAEADDDVLTKITRNHYRMVDPAIRGKVYDVTRQVLAISWSDSDVYQNNVIDFDDQKWFAVCKRPGGHKMSVPLFDTIFIDEVQDVNMVDIEMLDMVLKPEGFIVGVGDKNQSIYGFRGADSTAVDVFVKHFEAVEKPLSITYRCGSDIVAHAQQLVKTIQAAPNAPKGEVLTPLSFDPSFFDVGDMVLCRNNAPLVDFAYKLISARIPTMVKGRQIGKKLADLIEQVAGEKHWKDNPRKPGKQMPYWTVEGVSIPAMMSALNTWQTEQIEMIREEDPDDEAAVRAIKDRIECISVFTEHATGDAQSVIDEMAELFSDEDGDDKVVCATIHKSKGLEADRVWIYAPELLYPDWVPKKSWMYEQERNLDYVARTRAKSLLGYLPQDGWKDNDS